MRPFDPALLRAVPESRGPLALLGAAGTAAGVSTIAGAFALTAVVVAAARGGDPVPAVAWLAGVFVVRGALAAATEHAAARAGTTVTRAVRSRLLRRWLTADADARPEPATAVTLATQGAASVEPYVARFLPALVTAAVVPVLAVATLAVVDWASALVVVATLPLLPLFAALIGRTTEAATRRRWRAMADLAGHFLDVVRGLPTLVAFGRAERQVATISRVSDDHRRATLRTLRIAFLSSAALELLATISVALVAVTCGLRLASGSLDLSTAMLAILLAPEAYWPVRRVGMEFHTAADGAQALADVLAAEASGDAPDAGAADGEDASTAQRPEPGADAELAGVGYTYPGAARAVLTDVSLVAGPGLTVVTGPSGAGKSTLLELLAGLRRPSPGTVTAPPAHLVTQRPFLPTGPLRAVLTLGNDASAERVWDALRRVGLDGLVAGLPRGLDTVVGDDGFGLSAGQRARIALARAVLAGERLLLLDEPTAHLDPGSAEIAHEVVRDLAGSRAVVVVTHRPELVQEADQHVHLAGRPSVQGVTA